MDTALAVNPDAPPVEPAPEAPATAHEPDANERVAALLHDVVEEGLKTNAPKSLVNAASSAWRAVRKDGLAGAWRRVLSEMAPFLADPEFAAFEAPILEALHLALTFAPTPIPPPQSEAVSPAVVDGPQS